jgi:ribonuclease HI
MSVLASYRLTFICSHTCAGLDDWIDNWKSNGWLTSKEKPVKNKELIEEVERLLSRLRKAHKISLVHIGNTKADKEGRAQATLLAESALISRMFTLTIAA